MLHQSADRCSIRRLGRNSWAFKLTHYQKQRRAACYLFLSPYHPETWPMDTIDRLVAMRERDEREFMIAVRSMTYGH